MKDFSIIADTTCDLSEEFQKKYDIKLVQGHLVFPGGKEIPAFVKWEEMGREEFYDMLQANPNDFTTAPPNAAEFQAAVEEELALGKDVLLMTISGGISGTISSAVRAAELAKEKYPDAVIKCIDTRRFGPGFGLMAVYASVLRSQGKSLEETAEYLETNKNRFHQAGWLDDLSFVAKKGRITHPKAFFGTLAGIKPLGEFDSNGLTTVIGKVKGAQTAYRVLLNYMEKTIENPEDQIIFIAHTNRLPQAEKYKALIEEKFHPKAIFINDVFPACGINIGPGLMAAYYVGTEISEDLSVEKNIISNSVQG